MCVPGVTSIRYDHRLYGGCSLGIGLSGSPYGSFLLGGGGLSTGGNLAGPAWLLSGGGLGAGLGVALGGKGPAPIIGTPF